MSYQNFIIILSSPSGVGKTTIAKAILAEDNNIEVSLSTTSRQMRAGEVNGKDYNFVTQTQFFEMIKSGEFLEYAEIFNSLYGSTRVEVEKRLSSGKDIMFDIDWQGTEQLKKLMPERIVSIFILPPSMEELERRIRSRATDSEEQIKLRLSKSQLEISHYDSYDYCLVNDKIENCLEGVRTIIASERIKRSDNKMLIYDLLSYDFSKTRE
jgi:guanylate kinase